MSTASSAPASENPAPTGERIDDIDVTAEMQGSFLEYAYSVIYARALPDARDGLKPVQRRIVYQMSEMGLRPDRGHVKSARVVGDVMGRLHPHGDTAIYDAMVRLAQPFVMRVPLVDGHGNFGTLDDGPAASRYTEARLAPAALDLTEELGEDVVAFIPNYDNQLTQPEVLPAQYPNLLVNGASGIAVGMATNMAPHNLIEVVNAARHLLANPGATTAELMTFVPGPDLPSGGIIVGLDGIRDAYETGRGSFKTRAKVSIEQTTARRQSLVVTELPYMVGTEKVIDKIKDGVTKKKIEGISDVTDLTDRKNGLRLVIGIKTGFNPGAVLEQLYRLTPLEDSFSINNVTLVDGVPRTLGLVDLLRVYLDFRIDVVRRRSTYRLTQKRDRLHLVEGLLIAIADIDEVIQVIRTSDDADQARTRLREIFDLSVLQADYILELRLRRLTRFSRIELDTEAAQLRAAIAELEGLLGDRAQLTTLVGTELEAAAERLGTPRRTVLMSAPAAAAMGASSTTSAGSAARSAGSLEIPDVACEVVVSTTGRMIRIEVDPDATEVSAAPPRRSRHDAVLTRLTTTTRTEIGAVTSAGRLVRFTAVDLPSVPANSVQLVAGTKAAEYLGLEKNERLLAIVDLDSAVPLAVGTRHGVVKRVTPGAWPAKPVFDIISLKPGDEVVGATPAADDADLVFITSNAHLLHYAASLVRPQGAAASGMAGVSLASGATVIFFGAIGDPSDQDPIVVTLSHSSQTIAGTDPGRVKVSSLDDFPTKGRATGGVRAHAFLKGEDALALAWAGAAPALAVAADGAARALPDHRSKRDASGEPLDTVIGSIGGLV